MSAEGSLAKRGPPAIKGRGRPFPKGVSGNPGGRPKEIQEIVDLARQACPAAIRTLKEITLDENAPPAARVHAANSLLDRGYGKPKETVDLTGKISLEALVLASMEHRAPAQSNAVTAAPVRAVEAPAALEATSLATPMTASYSPSPEQFNVVLAPSAPIPPTRPINPDPPPPAAPAALRALNRGFASEAVD